MFRLSILGMVLLMAGCDSSRVYETNYNFEGALWPSSDTVTFEITVPDSSLRYNVLLNVRNTIDFKTARLFVQYQLSDSSSSVLRKRLVEQNLFDKKTGEPFGDSGLGNIYAHQFLLEPKMAFPRGLYKVKLSHMMRYDTLEEIRSVGIRLEKAPK